MSLNLPDEQRQQKYLKARAELDRLFSEFNGKINPHIKEVIDYKAYSTLSLMREWADLYHSEIREFADIVDFTGIQKNLGTALSQYTKYVYNYRFCNNLIDNILFRKILSFEMYFFSKNDILKRKKEPKIDSDKYTDNEALFYLSPLGHFMFYRIQKEFHLRTHSIAEAEAIGQLYEDILVIIRISLQEFFSNYQNNGGKIHSQDDFRKYLNRSESTNLASIIKFIEKNLKIDD